MGGGYSASASSSASSSAANKINTTTTFGGVAFGNQTAAGSNTVLYLGLGALGLLAAWLFLK